MFLICLPNFGAQPRHGRRFAKIDAVFLEILVRLRRIPRQRLRISVAIVRMRCTSCLTDRRSPALSERSERRDRAARERHAASGAAPVGPPPPNAESVISSFSPLASVRI
jgi:hypothetical protein